MLDQLGADHRQGAHAHVDHHRLARPGQCGPVQRDAAFLALALQVAGGEHQHAGVVAVRERDAGAGRGALRGADAGHGLAGNAFGDQGLGLFAAAAKDVGIATLEAHQRLAGLGQAHHEFDDAFLGQGVVAALLADVDALGVLGNLAQHIVGHQVVVEHHARAGQHAGGLEGQQFGVTGSCTDQRHAPPFRR